MMGQRWSNSLQRFHFFDGTSPGRWYPKGLPLIAWYLKGLPSSKPLRVEYHALGGQPFRIRSTGIILGYGCGWSDRRGLKIYVSSYTSDPCLSDHPRPYPSTCNAVGSKPGLARSFSIQSHLYYLLDRQDIENSVPPLFIFKTAVN